MNRTSDVVDTRELFVWADTKFKLEFTIVYRQRMVQQRSLIPFRFARTQMTKQKINRIVRSFWMNTKLIFNHYLLSFVCQRQQQQPQQQKTYHTNVIIIVKIILCVACVERNVFWARFCCCCWNNSKGKRLQSESESQSDSKTMTRRVSCKLQTYFFFISPLCCGVLRLSSVLFIVVNFVWLLSIFELFEKQLIEIECNVRIIY